MKFKKPYSQYIGKGILYDGKHKHIILRSYSDSEEIEKDWVHFDTICISYLGYKTRLEIDEYDGFTEESEEVELDSISSKERQMAIEFLFEGNRK